MAGLPGKSAWLGVAKQSAKGTVNAVPTFRNPFSGGNIAPVRETDRLTETDSARDQGAAYVTTSGVEGTPEIYVRDASIGLYLLAGFGTDTITGTTNFTHTFTPSNSTLPFLTFFKNVGGPAGLFERYQDCQVTSLTFSAAAGSPLTCAVGVQGVIPTRLTSDPAGATVLESAQVINFNNAAVTLGGAATSLIRSFDFTIENNITRQQTDDVVPYDLSAGQREISLGFDMLFENLDEYNKFHYGGISGTVESPTIFTSSAVFTFTLGANNELSFSLPSIAYEEFPVEPSPSGDPITVSVRAVAQKATGVPNLVTAVLKNQTATY